MCFLMSVVTFVVNRAWSLCEEGVTHVAEGRGRMKSTKRIIKQKTPLRMYQYRTVKLLKTMKVLLKKLKARRNQNVYENSLKKLIKLRKWMDSLSPALQLNMKERL